MNVADIRAQLAAALSDVVFTAENRSVLVDGFPAAVINIDRVTPETFGDTAYDIDVTVQVLVSKADAPDGWQTLDALISDNSISDALRDAQCVAAVGAYDNIGEDIAYNDGTALGFTIAVTVHG